MDCAQVHRHMDMCAYCVEVCMSAHMPVGSPMVMHVSVHMSIHVFTHICVCVWPLMQQCWPGDLGRLEDAVRRNKNWAEKI